MNYLYLLYLVILACGSLSGLARYKLLDKASRILLLWLGITFLTELAAYYAAIVYRNNIAVYAFANIVQVTLLCIYFHHSIPGKKGRKTGYFWAMVSILAGVANLVFFQPPHQLGTYFLIYTGVLVMAYCLFGFSRFLASPVIARLQVYPHFWFMIILAAFWLVTLLNWILYNYFREYFAEHTKYLNLLIIMANIAAYTAVGIIFLLYPKMIRRYNGR